MNTTGQSGYKTIRFRFSPERTTPFQQKDKCLLFLFNVLLHSMVTDPVFIPQFSKDKLKGRVINHRVTLQFRSLSSSVDRHMSC